MSRIYLVSISKDINDRTYFGNYITPDNDGIIPGIYELKILINEYMEWLNLGIDPPKVKKIEINPACIMRSQFLVVECDVCREGCDSYSRTFYLHVVEDIACVIRLPC